MAKKKEMMPLFNLHFLSYSFYINYLVPYFFPFNVFSRAKENNGIVLCDIKLAVFFVFCFFSFASSVFFFFHFFLLKICIFLLLVSVMFVLLVLLLFIFMLVFRSSSSSSSSSFVFDIPYGVLKELDKSH